MALKECRECGARVSTEAVSCPQCGAPDPTRVVDAGVTTGRVQASYASPESMTASENPIYRARMHWGVYVHAMIFAILTIATLIVDTPPEITVGLGIITVIMALVGFVKTASAEFVITSRRLIAKRGIVSRRTIETLLEKVEAVSVEQGLAGRIFGYGTVTVHGTGGTVEKFTQVSKPMELRKVIHEQIDMIRPAGRMQVR